MATLWGASASDHDRSDHEDLAGKGDQPGRGGFEDTHFIVLG